MIDIAYSINFLDYYGKERVEEGRGGSYGFVCFCLFVLSMEIFVYQTMYFLCLNVNTF